MLRRGEGGWMRAAVEEGRMFRTSPRFPECSIGCKFHGQFLAFRFEVIRVTSDSAACLIDAVEIT